MATRELKLLRSICDAFASASDIEEAARTSVRLIRAIVGAETAGIRIFLPDTRGALRQAFGDGHEENGLRGRSAKRRQAFGTKMIVGLSTRGVPGYVVLNVPLLFRGESVGVLEVLTPQEKVEEWPALQVIASQLAGVIANVRQREHLDSQIDGLRRTLKLVGDSVRTNSPGSAVESMVSFLEDFQVPCAAWVTKHEPLHLFLIRGTGMPSRDRRALRAQLRVIPRWDSISSRERALLAARFGAIAGDADVFAIDAGQALVLAAGVPAALCPTLNMMGELVRDLMRQSEAVRLADRQNERLNTGIAWTAHEFRGPLFGALAAIRSLRESVDDSARPVLDRAGKQLEHLADMVDSLLRVLAGTAPLHFQAIDLVDLVREVIDSYSSAADQDRLTLTAPRVLMVDANRNQLRSAMANLVVNALAYSPRAQKVDISLRSLGSDALLGVKDRGPGVPADERGSIFDPFSRGGQGLGRTGHGLGLFIARRVVEAHGGVIWVESKGKGATFLIRLPVRQSPTMKTEGSTG